MEFGFPSQDSSRSRRPAYVGIISTKRSGPDAPITKKLYANEQLLVGRDHRKCQIAFSDSSISNGHLRFYSIIFDQDQSEAIPPLVYAEDLSRNGTYWNGHLMGRGNGGFLLSSGDVLKLSKNAELEFSYDEVCDAEPLQSKQREEAEKLFSDSYLITDRKVGSGGYGQVYMAINQFNHRQMACKVVSLVNVRKKFGAGGLSKFKSRHDTRPKPASRVNAAVELKKVEFWSKRIKQERELAEKLKTYDREMEILQALDHPNIIRLEKVFKTDDNIFMFLELITGGDLFSYLEYKNGKLLDIEAALIIRQILMAIKYLHDKGIVHRDLKPENILLTSLSNGARVVLTDFGAARWLDKGGKRMTTNAGTHGYIAPEVNGLNRTTCPGYTKAADMWSLGCLTVVMLTGGSMFRDPRTGEYSDQLASECNLDRLNNDSDWLYVGYRPKGFVKGLVVLDEKRRMTANQALEHHWFTNGQNRRDFESVYNTATRNWKPRVSIGPVIENLTTDPSPKLSLLPKVPKRPIEPPYKPHPRVLFDTFYPRKQRAKSVEEYVELSQRSNMIESDSDKPANQGNEEPTLSNETIRKISKFKFAPQPAAARSTKSCSGMPTDCSPPSEIDRNTPLANVDEDENGRGKSRPKLLSRMRSDTNKRWPYSPTAWENNHGSVKGQSVPTGSSGKAQSKQMASPPSKRLKFEPLRPRTAPCGISSKLPGCPTRLESVNKAGSKPRDNAASDRPRNSVPSSAMGKLPLKSSDEDEVETRSNTGVKRKRKQEDSTLDIPKDDRVMNSRVVRVVSKPRTTRPEAEFHKLNDQVDSNKGEIGNNSTENNTAAPEAALTESNDMDVESDSPHPSDSDEEGLDNGAPHITSNDTETAALNQHEQDHHGANRISKRDYYYCTARDRTPFPQVEEEEGEEEGVSRIHNNMNRSERKRQRLVHLKEDRRNEKEKEKEKEKENEKEKKRVLFKDHSFLDENEVPETDDEELKIDRSLTDHVESQKGGKNEGTGREGRTVSYVMIGLP